MARQVRKYTTGATRNTDHDKHGIRGFTSRYATTRFHAYMHRHRHQADGNIREPDNWKKGIPLLDYADSLDRHNHDVMALLEGAPVRDNEDGTPITLDEALCGMWFNVQGMLHELMKLKCGAKVSEDVLHGLMVNIMELLTVATDNPKEKTQCNSSTSST